MRFDYYPKDIEYYRKAIMNSLKFEERVVEPKFLYDVGQTVLLQDTFSYVYQSPIWNAAFATVVRRHCCGIIPQQWYYLLHPHGKIDLFKEDEIAQCCKSSFLQGETLEHMEKKLKISPLTVQRAIELMEMVGCRYDDNSDIQGHGAVIRYGRCTVFIDSTGLTVRIRTKENKLNNNSLRFYHDYRAGMDFLLNETWAERYKIIQLTDGIRFIRVQITGEFKNDENVFIDDDPELTLKLYLCNVFEFKPMVSYSINPQHVDLARGFLLGTTPPEVALEYFCEFIPQVHQFAYEEK